MKTKEEVIDYINSIVLENPHTFYLIGNTTNSMDKTSDVFYAKYTWDTTPPTVIITSPVNNSYFNTTDISLSWNGSDNYGIDHYEVSDNGILWINVGLSDSYQFTNLSEGEYRLYVKAVDTSGNNATAYVKVTVDTTPPLIRINTPKEGELLNSTNITVSWMVQDSSPLKYTELEVDNGSWINVSNVSSYKLSLSNESYTIKIKSEDVAGNVGEKSVNITVDTTPPYLEIKSPTDGKYYNQTKMLVEWVDWDKNGIKKCMIEIDNKSWMDVVDSGKYLITLSNGYHTLRIKSIDNAGNSAIRAVNFTVDNIPPNLKISSVKQIGNIVQIKWDANDNISGIAYYMVKIDNGKWKKVTGNGMDINGLKVGTHMVTIRAYDKAGNFVEKNYTFKVYAQFPWLWVIIGVIVASIAIISIMFLLKRQKKAKEIKNEY